MADHVMHNKLMSEDEIWKKLWDIFLTEFLNSDKLKEYIDDEHMVFAKALNSTEELFKEKDKEKILEEFTNKNHIFKKLISFL
jgi:hypothetical protein